jgi:hypothetical protein
MSRLLRMVPCPRLTGTAQTHNVAPLPAVPSWMAEAVSVHADPIRGRKAGTAVWIVRRLRPDGTCW